MQPGLERSPIEGLETGSIKELRENVNTLERLMGNRAQALRKIAKEAEVPLKTIAAILDLPETVRLTRYDPWSEEQVDLTDFLPDPNADTADEAISNVYNTMLLKKLEEVARS